MKINWSDLYSLVHAMTAAEKGYFKKFNTGFSGAEQKNYRKLFDVLASMKSYDAEMLENKILSKTKNIYSLRNFLHKQILQSLRMYNKEHNIAFILRDHLDTIAILNAKGLNQECIELIEEGILISQQYGMTNYSILFLTEKRQQLKFYAETKRNQLSNEIRESLMQKARSIINKEFIKESHLKSIHWINTYSPLRDPVIRSEAEKLYDELITIPETEANEHNEINLQYAAIANICSLLDRRIEAINYQEKTVRLMEGLDVVKMDRVISYAAAIYNLCNLTLLEKDIERSAYWLNKLKSINALNEPGNLYIKALATHAELFLNIIDNSAYNEQLVDEIEKFLLQQHPIPNVFFDTQLLLLNYYVQHAHLQAAAAKSFLLINTNYKHSQISFQVHARLMHILVHYKLANFELMPSLIRSTYRYMGKLNLQFTTEKLLLKFFSKLLRRSGKFEITTLFSELYNELGSLIQDATERQVMVIYFDYHTWLKKELIIDN